METSSAAALPATFVAPFRLGEVDVAPAMNRLLGPDHAVRVEPRVMAVLVRLAQTPGAVVPRDVLIGAAWGEAFVSDEGLTQAVSRLRRALAEAGGPAGVVETIPKGGYRLALETTSPSDTGDGMQAETVPAPPGAPPPPRRVWTRWNVRWAVATAVGLSLGAGALGVGYGLGRGEARPVQMRIVKKMRPLPADSFPTASRPVLMDTAFQIRRVVKTE